MKHICNGMEYSTVMDGDHRDIRARNNYGTPVCCAEKSACRKYWEFRTYDGEYQTQYCQNVFQTGYTVEQQLVRWFASLD